MQGNGNGQSPPSGNGSTATRSGTPQSGGVVAAPERAPVLVGAPPATIRPRRKLRFDYRLRGLDLQAPVFAEAAATATPRRNRRSRRRRIALWWLAALSVAAGVAVAIRTTALTPFTVPTNAMTPTLQAGDRIVVVTSSLLHGSIGRGELVVFHQGAVAGCSAGTNGSQDLVQRVIGLPGETVTAQGSSLLVNGTPLREAGWFDPSAGPLGTTPVRLTTVPADSYMVLNDNRADACDSRSFGTIQRSQIVGTVFMVVTRHGHPHFHIF
jgi:signal peptidase I